MTIRAIMLAVRENVTAVRQGGIVAPHTAV
jgi:hypothetical protein